MGKDRRTRRKLHIEAKGGPPVTTESDKFMEVETSLPLSIGPQVNIFEGLNIDFDSVKKSLNNDDLHSVKSFKSVKSELGKNTITKKDKLKLRREMFLKKFEILHQMKEKKKIHEKRKNTPVTGDMNPLQEALPSLESLLKNTDDLTAKRNSENPNKKLKGIEKSRKQKRKQLQDIKVFKQVLKNKQFQNNPLEAVTQHLKVVLTNENK